ATQVSPLRDALKETSRQQPLHDFSILYDLDRPASWGKQFLVCDNAKLVVDRCGHVFDSERIFVRLRSGCVGCTVDLTFLDPTPGKHDAEHPWPMIAAGVFVDLGRAPELCRH